MSTMSIVSIWQELEDKLHDDGTYHVTRQLMVSIIHELEAFRRSQAAGCIVPNLPGLSQITASYTKGEPKDRPVIRSRKKL